MPSSTLTESKTPETALATTKPTSASWMKRAAVVSIALFCAINGYLWTTRFARDRVSTQMWNGSGSIDLAVNSYQALHTRPKVVLLGSSLMMYPFWAMDRELDPNVPDIFRQRESLTLERALAKPGEPKPLVFSFAIFGQMISDAYLYVDEFLKGDKAPEYLVFGIAPRDFHDFDLPAPMSTFSFKRLVNLHNFASYAAMYLPEFQDKADFVLGKVCFFYGKRWNMQKEFNKGVGKVARACGIEYGAPPVTSTQAAFMLNGTPEQRMKNSLLEYARRYKNIDESRDVALQMSFLQRLLKDCSDRHIKAIIVNMPLTDVNRQLLPADFLPKYSGDIAAACRQAGAQYVDLSAAPEFSHTDFWDSTHLNHAGGHKLVNRILPLIN